MAATRLIPLHENKGKTVSKCLKDRVDYAKNGEKTEQGEYVSAYECNPEIVDQEFYSSRSEYLKDHRVAKGDVIAYQIRQSFKPGEITPEEANEIGYELASRFTKGNHAFIVATHTDKAHIHNHIIFNSTNLACDRKFKNFFLSSFVIQRISDGICLEHGLSVIKPKAYGQRSKRTDYPERPSFRDEIRKNIDAILEKKPKDLEEFLKLLEAEGYEIKRGKNIAIKRKEQNRFIRFRSLGDGYGEDELIRIISGEKISDVRKSEKKIDLLIDIQEKLSQGKGAGYERWAKIHNIKQIAQTLLFLEEQDIRSLEVLVEKASSASVKLKEISQKQKELEARLIEIAALKKHIINYTKTKDVYTEYRKSGYSKKFYEEHREAITLHKAAKEAFSQIDGKIPKIRELNEEYERVLKEKKKTYAEYRQAQQEMREYQTAKYNVEQFLKSEGHEKEQQQKKKNEQSL